MGRRRLLSLILTLVLWAPALPLRAHAQAPEPPLVVFVDDTTLQTASVTNDGRDGLTRLQALFQQYGARVERVQLSEPLPAEAQVVVLVRPLRALPTDQLARLWVHLARGHHLLLAVDPLGLPVESLGVTTASQSERANGGLALLLYAHYGIRLHDTLVAEPWFGQASVQSQLTAFTYSYPEDFAVHPIIAPLAPYALPVPVWGARTLAVEPVGLSSHAFPLLYSETAFGETNQKVFGRTPEPLLINLPADPTGHLLLAGVGENRRLDSKVAVLGDAEILLNGYGLAVLPGGAPQFLGAQLLAQRLVGWLLDVPEDEWPGLPEGFTWLAIDGQRDDWDEAGPLAEDPAGDAALPAYDITGVYAFRDDSYLYLRLETAAAPSPLARLTLDVENTFDGVPDATFITEPNLAALHFGDDSFLPVLDSVLAAGDAIELRLPLRLLGGEGALIGRVCLSDSRTRLDGEPLDCTDSPPLIVPVASTQAPAGGWSAPGPLVRIASARYQTVNLRIEPSTGSRILAAPAVGSVLAATGRTPSGEWIQVENARLTGWLAGFLTQANVDPASLPIVGGVPEGAVPSEEEAGTLAEGEPPGAHVVQLGDTLYGIARRYNVSVNELIRVNGITDPNRITVGQTLIIP